MNIDAENMLTEEMLYTYVDRDHFQPEKVGFLIVFNIFYSI